MRNSLFSWNWRRTVGQEERSHELEYSQDTKGRPLKLWGGGGGGRAIGALLNTNSQELLTHSVSPCPPFSSLFSLPSWVPLCTTYGISVAREKKECGLLNCRGTLPKIYRCLQDCICASTVRGDSTEVWSRLGVEHKQGLSHESFPKAPNEYTLREHTISLWQ